MFSSFTVMNSVLVNNTVMNVDSCEEYQEYNSIEIYKC